MLSTTVPGTSSSRRPAARSVRAATPPIAALRGDLLRQRRFRVQQLQRLTTSAARDRTPSTERRLDEVTIVLQAAARSVLADIDAALHGIEQGTYGKCQKCDTAIPPKRLRTLPMTPLCMPCQHDREQTTTPAHQELEV